MTSEPESRRDTTETTVEDTETASDTADASLTDDKRPSRGVTTSRVASWCLEHWRAIVLSALAVGGVGLAVGLFLFLYRPDREIDDAAAQRAIGAASDGAVAALSYSPDNMVRDFADAKSHLTGEFLDYYDKFTKEMVTPIVQQKRIAQTATVVRAAISELHPNSAVVLVFLNETTVGKDKKEPLTTPSSVRITLTKVDGSWLISKLDPYG